MKKHIIPLFVIFLVMTICPWAAVSFAPADAGMAICFLLFFGLNPVCSLYIGIFSGMAVRKRWYLPFANGAVFLLSAWGIFAAEEPAFQGYAIAYVAVGLLAMIVTVFVMRGIRREMEA